MYNIVEYLNKTVWCRLAPGIHGVGVFAIRDIPKGQELTDYYGHSDFPSYLLKPEEFNRLDCDIQYLIRQQTIFEDRILFDSPNSHQLLEVFMNHSDEPNSDGKRALKDIKQGEEVTKDYKLQNIPII